jgi:hypothetical protein
MLPCAFPVRPMIFTSRRHIGRDCASFFCFLVRIIATYDIFTDGLFCSILSSLAQSVTKEAVVVRRSSKKLQLLLGAMHMHLHLTRNEKPSRSQPKTHNRRSARGEHYTFVQLIVCQKKIRVSTDGQTYVGQGVNEGIIKFSQ